MVMQKQGTVTIEINRSDSQNGLSTYPMKITDSSKVTSKLDIWSSILNQKNKDEASQLKTPYIHPLVKKSKSYLSEKSLNICTENLGSETGSDDFFFSYTSSEDTNSDDDVKLKEKTNIGIKPRCFPPPLPSLTSQSQCGQSQSLHMRFNRDNGRLSLFLQQVDSVPSHNNFFAKRQNGRLILTFTNDEVGEIADEFEEDVKEKTKMSKSELVVNKEIELVDKKSKLLEKFNKVSNFEDVKVVQQGSLPLINGYEYYWRNKATRNVTEQQNGISNNNKVVVSRNMNIYQVSNDTPQQFFVLRGKNVDY